MSATDKFDLMVTTLCCLLLAAYIFITPPSDD